MSDLFEQVFHHINGSETEIQNWQTLDGIKTVEFQSFGPDRWIESVHERGRMTGIECLAIILFALDESLFDPEPARRIVEGWAAELRKAVSTGEIQARDPFTLLALPTLPDGWEGLLSTADANKFIAARGMAWRFDELARQLFTEFEQAIQKRRFPPWTWETKQPAPATETAAPAPVVQATETMVQRQDRRLQACIDAGLPMNTKAALSRLPDGVGDVADHEGLTRQAFSADVKAALKRRENAVREGATVHRA